MLIIKRKSQLVQCAAVYWLNSSGEFGEFKLNIFRCKFNLFK
ncbi:hypothetical protein BLL52_3961 [Rhodoferax antarcticus ANT.BR]|uniref:Uncharacterized protein n=1 Tax=Rhodoferax antarcticus ANT.BR TaxID=1111071 RepID=A0A1Q8YAP0_9BURK|nr:hypothetical protein BLL52_3961 [Rhodoferax antarcticus ANT.BR]